MSFVYLEARLTPVARYGRPLYGAIATQYIPYDGTPLPGFVLRNGGNPDNYRQFLLDNRVGSVFDLEDGVEVALTQEKPSEQFSANPGWG